MPLYSYAGRGPSGTPLRGSIEARSRDHALQQLRDQGVITTQLRESPVSLFASRMSGGGAGTGRTGNLQDVFDAFGFSGVSQKALAVWTRKLSQMLRAGLDYLHLFTILAEESDNARLTKVSRDIRDQVRAGSPLTDAFKRHPGVFPPVYLSMVHTGEVAGRMDTILEELARVYDKEVELRQSIMSRLYYPIGLLIVALLLVGAFIFFVPQLLLGSEQQAIFGRFFSAGSYLAVLAFYGTIIALILLIRTRPGWTIFRRMLCFVPYIGILLKKLTLIRFCRLLAAMWAAGVPLLEALEVVEETVPEAEIKAGIREAAELVKQGEDLTESLRASGVFPQRVLALVRTGEVAGNVEAMLLKVAEYYEMEADSQGQIIGVVGYFVIYGIVALTVAMFVISAWSGYFSIITDFMGP